MFIIVYTFIYIHAYILIPDLKLDTIFPLTKTLQNSFKESVYRYHAFLPK